MDFQYEKYDYKVAFLDEVLSQYSGQKVKMLDMGCGTSKDYVEILDFYRNVEYVGVDFRGPSLNRARATFENYDNVCFISGFGEELQMKYTNYFDVTLSLSVLEHVKDLPGFISTSTSVTKTGGKVIHRYDLGHALHSNLYEKIKVFLCKNIPLLMPAKHFTTHPQRSYVEKLLEESGVHVEQRLYSQLPGLKAMMNRVNWDDKNACELSRQITDLDRKLYYHMEHIFSERELEYFFPAITIIGIKS